MNNKISEKKVERISKLQKQKLVDYMSENLEFARGQFAGVNSNSNFKDKWESLKDSLNSLGGSGKTVEQWKKCWIDLKGGVKKTINARRQFMNRTGGGSWTDGPRDLSSIEEQILNIITVDAVDGDSCTPESGVANEESFEEYVSVEFLEGEESYEPPRKVSKTLLPSTSSKSLENVNVSPPAPHKKSSKYNLALDEARAMQDVLIRKLSRLEQQNIEILARLDKIEKNSRPSATFE